MGEAKRKRDEQASTWPGREAFHGTIKLHALAPVAAINGWRIRELTGDDRFPADTPIILRTFRTEVGDAAITSASASAMVRRSARSGLLLSSG